MRNPNAIVATIERIEPPLDRRTVDLLRAGERGLQVEFEGKRSARLDPADPRSAGFAEILDELRKMGRPVYVEVEPETQAIRRLLIPLQAQVTGIRQDRDGDFAIDLTHSHARHLLRHGAEDFDALLATLRRVQKSGDWLIVIENDAHEVFDVEICPPPRDIPGWHVPTEIPKLPPRRWWWPWHWFGCISAAKAQQMFALVANTSCDPLTVPAPCIPFRYPDDGCWGRAHEMCRLMLAAGVTPGKVWIQGWLQAQTKNNPNCHVNWGWHVAPTLCVRGTGWWGWFFTHKRVIDPALFTAPVSQATWKSVQGDPDATLTPSNADIFYLWGSQTDPTYAQTNQVLATYRLQLKNRSLQLGPPPYANCP